MPVNEASNDSMPSSPLSLDHLSFHTHSIEKKILQSKSRKMLIGNDGVQNTSESHSSSIQSDIDFLPDPGVSGVRSMGPGLSICERDICEALLM